MVAGRGVALPYGVLIGAFRQERQCRPSDGLAGGSPLFSLRWTENHFRSFRSDPGRLARALNPVAPSWCTPKVHTQGAPEGVPALTPSGAPKGVAVCRDRRGESAYWRGLLGRRPAALASIRPSTSRFRTCPRFPLAVHIPARRTLTSSHAPHPFRMIRVPIAVGWQPSLGRQMSTQ